MRILVVEDDTMLAKSLRHAIEDGGMTVDWVSGGTAALEAISGVGYAAILLDLSIPELNGLTVLMRVREDKVNTPIVVITARDDLEVRVKALDLGADDFVVKPFDAAEILARIRAVVRRHAGHATSRFGTSDILLDLASHEASYKGRSEILPHREFALMRALLERPGTILSRAQLEERVYGWGEEVESNAVEVLIFCVRRRFGKDIIRNVRGAGWMVLRT